MEILVHNLSHADLIVKISDGVPSPSGVHEYKVRPHIHGISVTASLCRCSFQCLNAGPAHVQPISANR